MATTTAIVVQAVAALPPCAATHAVLDFTGTRGGAFPLVIRRYYPRCKISVHVENASQAASLDVLFHGIQNGPETQSQRRLTQFVTVLPKLHVTKRSLEVINARENTANSGRTAVRSSQRATAGPTTTSKTRRRTPMFHRILATISMRARLHRDDRTLHNYCAGLLASLMPGGVCVLMHDATGTAFAHGSVDYLAGNAQDGAGTRVDDSDEEDELADEEMFSSVTWLLALEAVGFSAVEVCYQIGGSFILAARSPSLASWDSWLAREPPAYARSFHAQGTFSEQTTNEQHVNNKCMTRHPSIPE